FRLVVVLLAALWAVFCFRDPRLQLALPILFLNGVFWIQLIGYALLEWLVAPRLEQYPVLGEAFYWGLILWYGLVSLHAVVLLTPVQPLARLAASSLLLALFVLPDWYIELPRFWERDYRALYQQQAQARPSLDAEAILSHQW